jgi:hypothetical protein
MKNVKVEDQGINLGRIELLADDVNGDDMINIMDMGTFRKNFGKTAAKDCTVIYGA